jgi:hypothetical protein
LASTVSGDRVQVTIRTEDDIYQEQPWVAVRSAAGEYSRLDTVKSAPGTWDFSYSRRDVDRVVVGVSDVFGNESQAEVDDGSRRWAIQSEFAAATLRGVDFDSVPTQASLARSPSGYEAEGALTFEHSFGDGGPWRTIRLVGDAPPGTALDFRYKTAATREGLDEAAWSAPQESPANVPPGMASLAFLRVEVQLRGTPEFTPVLDFVEVTHDPAGMLPPGDQWMIH